MKRVFRVFSWLFGAVFVLLAGLIIFAALPISEKYYFFTVQSGSMEPTIKTGSLIFTHQKETYQVDDIVTRKMENSEGTVTHRIVRESEGKFFTKGDANDGEDREEVLSDDIVGKVFLIIPYVGYPIAYSKTSQGFIVIVVIPATILIYEELRKISAEVKKGFKNKQKVKDNKEEGQKIKQESNEKNL